MKYLLDTNFISELRRPRPNSGVQEWLMAAPEANLFLSVATVAELIRGVERLPPGTQRLRLATWMETELTSRFWNRILPVDIQIARAWGKQVARRDQVGRPMEAMDGLIAATCAVYDLTLVTRNVADFEGSVERIVNPWA